MWTKSFLSIIGLLGILMNFGTASFGQDNTVVLYTAHNATTIEAMRPLIEKETGMKTDIIKMASADIIRRVNAEKDNPRADVIWGIGGDQLEANSELLVPYIPKEWDKIDPVYKVGTNWMPYTSIVMVFIVNTNLLKSEEIPQSWADLQKPQYKELISSARADKSGSSYIQLVTVLNVFQDKGWSNYKSILANFALSGSSSAVSRFVNDGEAAIGLTLEDNAYQYVINGGPVTIVYPTDGTTALPDGVALVKGGPNPGNGKAFINWALSKKTQEEYIVNTMGRRSVRTDVKALGALPSLTSFKTVPYDFQRAARNKKQNVKKWRQLVIELDL